MQKTITQQLNTPLTTAPAKVDWKLPLAVALTLIFWGSSFAGIRRALRDFSPFHLALYRFSIASVVMVGFALVKKIRRPERADLPRIIGCGVLGVALYHAALNFG